jgi:hypothetical protein
MRRLLVAWGTALGIVGTGAAASAQSTIVVATSGTDSPTCGPPGQTPCRTLQSAVYDRALRDPTVTRIELEPGTHDGLAPPAGAVAQFGRGITITSRDGARRARISQPASVGGVVADRGPLIRLDRVDGWRVSNLLFAPAVPAAHTGVDASGCHNLEIADNEFADTFVAIHVRGDATTPAQNVRIAGNQIRNATGFGISVGFLNEALGVAQAVRIESNVITGVAACPLQRCADRLWSVGVGVDDAADVVVANNGVFGRVDFGVWLGSEGAATMTAPTAQRVLAAHNTVAIAPANEAATVSGIPLVIARVAAARVQNNILTRAALGPVYGIAASWLTPNGTAPPAVDHDAFDGSSALDRFAVTVDASATSVTFMAWQARGLDANAVRDPGGLRFAGPGDFHLAGGSPARHAGMPIGEVTSDVDGDGRDPRTPDIGFDEYRDPGVRPPDGGAPPGDTGEVFPGDDAGAGSTTRVSIGGGSCAVAVTTTTTGRGRSGAGVSLLMLVAACGAFAARRRARGSE